MDKTIFWLFFHSCWYRQGIIFRFKFLMLVTLTCAAMTVIFFILNQVSIIPLIINMDLNGWFYDNIMLLFTFWPDLLKLLQMLLFSPGQWRSLALGRLHSPDPQWLSHRDLQHVEPVCFHHYLPLCSLPQVQQNQVGRQSTHRSVTFPLSAQNPVL